MFGKKTWILVNFSYVCENKYWILSLEKPWKNINRICNFESVTERHLTKIQDIQWKTGKGDRKKEKKRKKHNKWKTRIKDRNNS